MRVRAARAGVGRARRDPLALALPVSLAAAALAAAAGVATLVVRPGRPAARWTDAPGRAALLETGLASRHVLFPALSGDGRLVAFSAIAPDEAAGAPAHRRDVFVRDVLAGTTTRVSVAGDGSPASGDSQCASLSADGGTIAFSSNANNLVPSGPPGVRVFVRDLVHRRTSQIPAPGGTTIGFGCPTISANGRFVAFHAGASPDDVLSDLFVHELATGATTKIAPSSTRPPLVNVPHPVFSSPPALSADGRYVAFASDAANLEPADGNGQSDVFLHDRETGLTTLVSAGPDGAPMGGYSHGAAISADGGSVAFLATTEKGRFGGPKFDLYVYDRATGRPVRERPDGPWLSPRLPALSPDGRSLVVEVEHPSADRAETVVIDRQSHKVTRVSAGAGYNGYARHSAPAISGDGRDIAFEVRSGGDAQIAVYRAAG
jgi:Tol biopolymer transport system component